jgi:hypothetical protein
MVALFTKNRGSETGNLIAMFTGIVFVAFLSNLPNDLWNMLGGGMLYRNPAWLPMIEFPWRIMAGTLATLAVALCFSGKREMNANSDSPE